jgi:type I restriction enzyme S subunit
MNKVSLLRACNITTGKKDSNAATKNGKYLFFTCAPEPLRINSFCFDDDVILLAGNNAGGNFHCQRYKGKFDAYQRTYILTAKEGYYLDFVYYSLIINLKQYAKKSQGSQTKFLTMKILQEFEIDEISFDEQKNIANRLKSIDSKIKNNITINAELESMAKTLYDYWFLQFEFPNKEGKPYRTSGGKMVWNEELKREIPEGWEVRTVKDCADVVSGYPFKTETYSKDGKYKIYTIGNVQDGYIDDTCPNKIDFIPDDMDRGCILKPCDIIMSLTGNVGRVGLVYTKNALLNQRVLKVEPLEGYHNFLYLLFRNSSFSRVMQRIASGTSQKNLSPNQVCDFKFAIPKKSLLDLFNKKVNGFIKAIVNNLSQNQELTSLRDFLLPLLMNGQVKFKD